MLTRPQFLTALAALIAAPFTAKSKETGRHKPVVFRESFWISSADAARGKDAAIKYGDEFIEKQCANIIMDNIRRSSLLKKAKIKHLDGSVEYIYLLKIVP
jgi:hypothetical protein